MKPSTNSHLSEDLIFRTLDDELTAPERFECELHFAVCEVCRLKLASLHEFSIELEAAVHATPTPVMDGSRNELQRAIENRIASPLVLQNPAKVMRRFAWGVGIAATLAFGVLLAPRNEVPLALPVAEPVEHGAAAIQTAAIEVDGETFLPLPYSNMDLSTASPHIVQMQVPISSLADLGIVLEPIMNRVGAGPDSERTVLADVLVGADGQPRGVHVLGSN